MATKAKKMKQRGGARPGAGRPPGKTIDSHVHVRIPAVELRNAKAAAKRDGIEWSEYVREALRRML